MIHVCFGLHDKTGRYSKFTGTAMLSMFENTSSKITVHILHDNTLTQENSDKFSAVAKQYNQLVKFYNVEELCADKITEYVNLVPAVKTSRVSVGAFYRLLIPQLLSDDIDKCIYLDSDIIVNLDISELWQIELDDKPLAAVPEENIYYLGYEQRAAHKYLLRTKLVSYKDYFNSGVMIVNLNHWKQSTQLLMEGIKWRREHPQCSCFDQDIFNYLFSKSYVKISEKFDRFVDIERERQKKYAVTRSIYHYIGSTLCLDLNDSFNRLWMSYFIKTPWFDENAMGRLYAGFQQIHIGFKTSLINLSTLMSGKTRGFIVSKDDVDAIKKLFAVQGDEELITVERDTPRQEIFERMNASRGKKIFFVFVPNFPFVNFEKLGFVYGRDFLNGAEFLSEAQGVPLNSYPLIQVM